MARDIGNLNCDRHGSKCSCGSFAVGPLLAGLHLARRNLI